MSVIIIWYVPLITPKYNFVYTETEQVVGSTVKPGDVQIDSMVDKLVCICASTLQADTSNCIINNAFNLIHFLQQMQKHDTKNKA